MSDAKHTPGPWFVGDWDNDHGDNLTTVEARSPEVLGSGQSSIWPDGIVKHWVASTEEGEFGFEGNVANARLIASAPCLLAALQTMERKASKQNWNDAYPDELAAARAAIAKATGAA